MKREIPIRLNKFCLFIVSCVLAGAAAHADTDSDKPSDDEKTFPVKLNIKFNGNVGGKVFLVLSGAGLSQQMGSAGVDKPVDLQHSPLTIQLGEASGELKKTIKIPQGKYSAVVFASSEGRCKAETDKLAHRVDCFIFKNDTACGSFSLDSESGKEINIECGETSEDKK